MVTFSTTCNRHVLGRGDKLGPMLMELAGWHRLGNATYATSPQIKEVARATTTAIAKKALVEPRV
eukprot:gene4287-14397_t